MSAQSRARVALVTMLALALAALLLLPALAAAPQKAAAADWESYVVKSDGTLWTWGGNAFGGLGRGDIVPLGDPRADGHDTDWKSVAHGNSLGTVALKQDGSSGTGATSASPSRTSPDAVHRRRLGRRVGRLRRRRHARPAAQGRSGPLELWSWGDNEWGQLGNGTSGPGAGTGSPIHIGSDLWTSVAAGYGHSLGVQSDGSLWAWGLNDMGQLGLGDNANRSAPTRIGSGTNWATVYCGSLSLLCPHDAEAALRLGLERIRPAGPRLHRRNARRAGAVTGAGWTDVAPGPLDCLGIKDDGSLWSWGYNADGQLGTAGRLRVPLRLRRASARRRAGPTSPAAPTTRSP